MWQVPFFVVVTLGLVYVSRHSLLRPRSHGFYRFFAWELMLSLLLLNAPYWFVDALAWHQTISWLLLLASLVPLILGVLALRARGNPDPTHRTDPQLMAFERTTTLVTEGVYRYIRHPLYSSLLLLNWGLFLKRLSLPGILLAICASILLVATAKRDEAECVQTFGTDYAEYMTRTRMFIPYVL